MATVSAAAHTALDKDGESGLSSVPVNGEIYNIPIEVTEKRHPVRVQQYAFHDEDGGAGKFRGGKGVVLDYEILSEEAALTAIFGRSRYPSWGLDGRDEGSPNRIEILRRGGEVEQYGSVARLPLSRGDVVRLTTGTGGGYGPPAERPRERVDDDLRNGYVTAEQAREMYGH